MGHYSIIKLCDCVLTESLYEIQAIHSRLLPPALNTSRSILKINLGFLP